MNQLVGHFESSKNLIVILDNHKAHHSDLFKEMTEKLGVEVLYVPPYSCRLNSIERLWATIKLRWRTFVL